MHSKLEACAIFSKHVVWSVKCNDGIANRANPDQSSPLEAGWSGFICSFDLILYVPSTIFQLNRDRLNQY